MWFNENEKRNFHIQTFGCQMNEHDSEIMAGMLIEKGFAKTEDAEAMDIAIINTCSIRENADNRFFGTLGQLKKRKEKNPNLIVCVCGCMMQQEHITDEIKKRYNWVDLILGTHNIHELPNLLFNVISEKNKIVQVWENGGEIVEGLPANRALSFRGLVNIMYGCNNFCTYCIVPYTRGRERSRRPQDIIEEVKNLVEDGVKEVILLGQNVNSYGINKHLNSYVASDDDFDFADLIYALNDIKGLERLKFMTSHPKDISDKLIEAYGNCKTLGKTIHLPVQSGSNKVLKEMNRHYTKEGYLEIVKKLKKVVPDISITTDIIVGFPGESEDDFLETLDLVEKVRFDSAFTFLYSIRKGTPAENFKNQVPEDIKHERFNRLLALVNNISEERNKIFEGTIQKILVEGESTGKNSKGMMSGRTENGRMVNFLGSVDLVGKIVEVEITEARQFNLKGKLL